MESNRRESNRTEGRGAGLRVVVVGATGNVGTSLMRALGQEQAVGSTLGLARRPCRLSIAKAAWACVDVADPQDNLESHFRGADAVVHLAWLFQPTHDPATTWETNVLGSLRVFDAVARSGVPALIHASSVGAYSPGPKDRYVDESWPTHGWPEAAYCREKAYLERVLDTFEERHPDIRVVRMRPGFLFKREAASEQRRLIAGPLVPQRLVRPSLIPIVPDLPDLRFQALHTDDAADAYRRAVVREVRGAFNLAADPVIDGSRLADLLAARAVRLPQRPVRDAVAAAWRLHLVPASPELFDAVLRLPLLDTARARTELEWTPRYGAVEALDEFLHGLRDMAGMDTAPLAARLPGGRLRELATGVGQRP
ncbi:NAD-dependent epimerase/dehydratase family protein [Streptomyces sp. NPDC020883]|uniref:NAD-dependent epimerase/dehydratase family protein n=1 Tax=Streptomyces sp. NPDC020883 TaxID=3365099 RepID=UPI00378D7D7C